MFWHVLQEDLLRDATVQSEVVPRVLLSTFFLNWWNICLFPFTEDCIRLPWHLNFTESVLATTLAIYFPWDPGMHVVFLSSFFRWSQTWSYPVNQETSFPHSLSWVSGLEVNRKRNYHWKLRQKIFMSTSAVFIVTSSAILWQGECIFFYLTFLTNMTVNSFLTVLCIPKKIQLQLHFNFHNPIPYPHGNDPCIHRRICSPGYMACAFPFHTSVWPECPYWMWRDD